VHQCQSQWPMMKRRMSSYGWLLLLLLLTIMPALIMVELTTVTRTGTTLTSPGTTRTARLTTLIRPATTITVVPTTYTRTKITGTKTLTRITGTQAMVPRDVDSSSNADVVLAITYTADFCNKTGAYQNCARSAYHHALGQKVGSATATDDSASTGGGVQVVATTLSAAFTGSATYVGSSTDMGSATQTTLNTTSTIPTNTPTTPATMPTTPATTPTVSASTSNAADAMTAVATDTASFAHGTVSRNVTTTYQPLTSLPTAHCTGSPTVQGCLPPSQWSVFPTYISSLKSWSYYTISNVTQTANATTVGSAGTTSTTGGSSGSANLPITSTTLSMVGGTNASSPTVDSASVTSTKSGARLVDWN
jgi:hypothetical protein